MRIGRSMSGAILALCVWATIGEADHGALLYHHSFDDFTFMEEDFVASSGLRSVDERGLTLEPGRFGNGLRVNRTPRWRELHNNSGVDLDMLTSAEFNTRMSRYSDFVAHNEPLLWGAGKVVPRAGAMAFWVKGALSEGKLIDQSAMAWGRSEKDLLAVTVDDELRLGGSIVDSRYVYHTIRSGEPWNPEQWNHVALNWDNSQGLELFVNGEIVGSSWGTDAWWETPLAGLLRFPMGHVVYDEFYSFSRPLTAGEISSLMSQNRVEASARAADHTSDAGERLARALGIAADAGLPVIRPMGEGRVLSFKEIAPSFIDEGKIPARLCQDGRYELAWPLRIGSFTIIPGDGIFPAEKLEIVPPQGTPFNYMTLEGNLADLPAALVDARKAGDRYLGKTYVAIPQNGGFFHGTVLERGTHPTITLPFLHGYGEADGYSGDVMLPITGDTRVHEVGLFDVTEEDEVPVPGEMVYHLCAADGDLEKRYAFARRALLPLKEQPALRACRTLPAANDEWVETGYLQRKHLITAPMTGKRAVGSIVLDLMVQTAGREDILLVRLRDPVLPHRIWTHAEVRLVGFDGQGARLRLALVSPALLLERGDRLWLDLATRSNARIRIGDERGSRIALKPAPHFEAERSYEAKAMLPALAERMFCHYRPWLFVRRRPNVLDPYTLGGQYDAVMPALATKRAMPHSRLADYYLALSGIEEEYWRTSVSVSGTKPEEIATPEGVPRWAHLQRVVQGFRYRVVEWMIGHQNDDGQLGEGWNDDVFILTGKSDMPLDGNSGARDMFLKVFRGIDDSHMLGDGFCQVSPIDTHHVVDFYCERWRAVPYALGDPYVIRRALETAWHADKPEETPVNYADGTPYAYDRNILSWYWDTDYPDKVFAGGDEPSIIHQLERMAVLCDDLLLFHYTEAWTPLYNLPGESVLIPMIIGGWEQYMRHPTGESRGLTIAWPAGGGEDVARWVTHGDSRSLACRLFSFDPQPRQVTAQPYMLEAGTYTIALSEDDGGKPGTVLSTKEQTMKRFDTFSVEIPPAKPVVLTAEQVERARDQGPYPDLAIAGYDCDREGSSLAVRVSNVGAARAGKSSLVVYDSRGRKAGKRPVPAIDAPLDFLEKSVVVEFSAIPATGALRIVVDESDETEEIYEGNNSITVE